MIKLWRGGRSRGLVLRGKLSILLLLSLSAVCGLVIYFHGKTVSYFLRPIWDTPPKAFQVYCASPSVSHQLRLPTVLSPLFCYSVAGIPSSSTGSVALCEELCQGLMDYGNLCASQTWTSLDAYYARELFFFILCYWQKYLLMSFMLCNHCVCRSSHTIMPKTFPWLIYVSSMAGVFAQILAGSLMQSCLAMRLICWKSVCRYFISFSSID